MMAPLGQAIDVTKRFGAFTAVDGVSLEVSEGEVVGLLGANGAGKTTLIRMLLGLLEPTAGEVRLFGRSPSRETRRRLGYVSQGLGLYEDLTVRENLAFAASAFGSKAPPLDQDLSAVRRELIRDLSLGYQRRVAFAAALAHRPSLLVLDEPTSGVDPLGRTRLWETIREAADDGAAAVVTTHYMEEAEYCDRLVVMAAGRTAAAGPMDEIVGDATTVEVRGPRWQAAYEALDAAGIPAALVGTALRVSGVALDRVRQALLGAAVPASAQLVPATFEETFVALTEAAA
jgi:ABC-2 type transport system ATP-binding protein/ribosome-dependent ATPase